MANPDHVAMLKESAGPWNLWREIEPHIMPDLSQAVFIRTDLREANLSGANLGKANFKEADLRGANLKKANLSRTNLAGANLWKADLREANLWGVDLTLANLREANLSGANLTRAALIATNFEGAILTDAKIYGVSVWDVNLQNAIQTNLVITQNAPSITVDNLDVAQFIYLLINNSKIRYVIDTITSKVVLILGRFTDERKATLNALRDALRHHDYLPILFDFEKPSNRDFTETVSTLAHLARSSLQTLLIPGVFRKN